MRLLVTGGSGQLARSLAAVAPPGAALERRDRSALDITRAHDLERALTPGAFDLVINTAAYTAVDRAQSEPEAAFAVNRDGAGGLAAACRHAGIPLLHLSTDYVFDGKLARPYREDDPVHPLSVYGASKEAGERAVRAQCPRHLILRSSWLFSPYGTNFVKTMLALARTRREIAVVSDQVGCPTAAGDLARAILIIARRVGEGFEGWGTYHLCGEPALSWHGFAQAIFDCAYGQSPARPHVRPISSADYGAAALRPANSALDCTLSRRTFGLGPLAWREALPAVLAAIARGEGA